MSWPRVQPWKGFVMCGPKLGRDLEQEATGPRVVPPRIRSGLSTGLPTAGQRRLDTTRNLCVTTARPSRKRREEGYHLTPDLVSKAKAIIADSKQVAPNPYADQFAQSSTNSARSMTDD